MADLPRPADADRNLLFGILALQMDFLTRDHLIAALNAWVLEKHKPLAQILEEQGFPTANFYEIGGKADTDPLFPDDPFMAANRRVTITLMREAPPLPPDLKP